MSIAVLMEEIQPVLPEDSWLKFQVESFLMALSGYFGP